MPYAVIVICRGKYSHSVGPYSTREKALDIAQKLDEKHRKYKWEGYTTHVSKMTPLSEKE